MEIKRVVSLLFGLVASEMFHILYFDTPFYRIVILCAKTDLFCEIILKGSPI